MLTTERKPDIGNGAINLNSEVGIISATIVVDCLSRAVRSAKHHASVHARTGLVREL